MVFPRPACGGRKKGEEEAGDTPDPRPWDCVPRHPLPFTGKFFAATPEAGMQGARPLVGGPGGAPPAPFFFNCRFRLRRNRQLKQDENASS